MNAKLKELTFEKKGHVYKLNGKHIPSVTQILNPISKVIYQEINQQTLQAKAAIGSQVHKLSERYLKFNYANPDEMTKDYFNNFLAYMSELKENHKSVEIIATEFKGYYQDDKMVYGGTIDCILKVDEEIWLIDWKTVSKPTELLLAMQMYGYKKIVNQLGFKVDRVFAVQLTKKKHNQIELTDEIKKLKIKSLWKVLYMFYKALDQEGLLKEESKINEEDL